MSTVTVAPGAGTIQAAVAANPTGTIFQLQAGTYRITSQITPKAGQVFQGALLGSVRQSTIVGSRVLSPWTQAGSTWFVTGQTQSGVVQVKTCATDCPRCNYPEELFVDGVRLKPVDSLSLVTATTFFFDYVADRIYIGFNPIGTVVETSVVPYAFQGSVTDVEIRDLNVTKFASPSGHGAVGGQGSGAGWIVDNCDVSWCHGVGIKGSNQWTITNNVVHDHAQTGLAGTGKGIRVEGNEVYNINLDRMFVGGMNGECGSTKFVGCKGTSFTDYGVLVKNNHFHDVWGPGPWIDIDNRFCIIEDNLVENCGWRGIFYEISYDGIIRNNTVTGCGFDSPFATPAATDGAGILVSNSPRVEVYGNTVSGNKHGICGREEDRGSGYLGVYNNQDLYVHDNNVAVANGSGYTAIAGGIADSDPNWDPYTAAANNRWRNNTYAIGLNVRFRWTGNSNITYAAWQAAGQDIVSNPPLTLQAGQWAYDAATSTLYVRCTDDANPSTKKMVAFDWRFGTEEVILVSTAGVLIGRLCRHFSYVGDAAGVDRDVASGPSMSYDGSRIAFASRRGGVQTNIYVVLENSNL